MSELGSDYEGGKTSIKTHKEILTLIEEIKKFEGQFGEHGITEPAKEELIEFEPVIEIEPAVDEYPEWDSLEPEGEIQKPRLKTKKAKKRMGFVAKPKTQHDQKPQVELGETTKQPENVVVNLPQSSIFKLRFDKDGNLVNLDFKKPKAKPKSTSKTSGHKAKEQAKETPEEGGETSKFSKLKTGIGKLSKIKGVIPGRRKKEEEVPATPAET